MHSVPWWTTPPAIVAEALTAVPDPLLTALRPGPIASGASVAASLGRSLAPPEDGSPAPCWLLVEQQPSFRRALAALRAYRGAVLADPVGSGKTYIALAVASALNRGATSCLVPATLLPQWKAAAHSLGIPVALASHEQASRGRLPRDTRGLVIIDESHRFRNRLTRRYTHVARWLVGRPALLVTATPIVNHLSDLCNQLLLVVRDNALAIDGVPSLRALFAGGRPHPALGQLVVENDGAAAARPRKILRISQPAGPECRAAEALAGLIGQLRLSRVRPLAALIRGVLLRAASSSPAALAASLQRYRTLLLHAREAQQAGCSLNRSELRRFTGELGDQLVLWELLPTHEGASELELSDLEMLEAVIPAAKAAVSADDPKLGRLGEALKKGPTLVFTASRDTVRYIRERLRNHNLAWCTGDTAGIGHTRLPRAAVLGWFRATAAPAPGPQHLVVTDVAAEGLDLQRAVQVVHYDLPWTPMRLEQREGRSVRLGSGHSQVGVVRFATPPALERPLRLGAILARKSALPGAAGMGPDGRRVWRWRADIATRLGGRDPVAGVAAVSSASRGLLAGVALYRISDPGKCIAAAVGWLDPGGAWTEDPDVVTERLLVSASQNQLEPVPAGLLRSYLELLAPLIRNRLVQSRGSRWATPEASPAVRAVAARLGTLIQQAARLRHERRLSELERALNFVSGGHTAGEEMLLEELVEGSAKDLTSRLSGAVPQANWDEIEARLTGLIVFGGTSELAR